MNAEPRLILRTEVLAQLLATVAAMPAGVKLSIPQLRDALVSQKDVLDGLQALVAANELDRLTLRPPAKVTKAQPSKEFRPTGAQLFKRVLAEVEARGITQKEASVAIFGHPSQLATMRGNHARAAASKTVERVEAWLASPPPPPPEVAAADPLAVDPEIVETSPFHLHREIQAFLSQHEVTASAFGKAVNGDGALVKAIREGRMPRAKTIAKIRTVIADPPAEFVRSRTPVGDRRFAASHHDGTQRPATPLMDEQERRTRQAARAGAAINRGREQTATRLVDRGADPAKQNSHIASQMREITRRRADEARQADPVEQAKLALQRKGRTVYSASVIGGKKDHFVVSGMGKEVTPAALIAEAERATGQSFRRTAGAR